MTRFDWAGLLRAGMLRGLAPREVWRLTPAELAFLLGKSDGPMALTRVRLEELAVAFPDKLRKDGDGRR
ncbi:phage tail assembly chaperone [Silicimonas sp. MF1-12-2]|uniref:phage tail assembly chaperone n=1 Tax=Silicimonas sp. MF1-12-2 TaxID=3384793 RepID=UPI0039B500F4